MGLGEEWAKVKEEKLEAYSSKSAVEAQPEPLNELLSANRSYLATLTDEERIEFIHLCMEDYCTLCGSEYLPCYCAPCYDI